MTGHSVDGDRMMFLTLAQIPWASSPACPALNDGGTAPAAAEPPAPGGGKDGPPAVAPECGDKGGGGVEASAGPGGTRAGATCDAVAEGENDTGGAGAGF